ncbi:MAG: hypothetical protein AAGA54_33125 [Myxococcota bacterium]
MSDAVVYLGADLPIRSGLTITFRARFTGSADHEAIRAEVERPHPDGTFSDTTIALEGDLTVVTTNLLLGRSPTGRVVIPLSFLGGVLGLWMVIELGDSLSSLTVLTFFMAGVVLLPVAVLGPQQARYRLKAVDLDAHQRQFESKCREALDLGSVPPSLTAGDHARDEEDPSSSARRHGA